MKKLHLDLIEESEICFTDLFKAPDWEYSFFKYMLHDC